MQSYRLVLIRIRFPNLSVFRLYPRVIPIHKFTDNYIRPYNFTCHYDAYASIKRKRASHRHRSASRIIENFLQMSALSSSNYSIISRRRKGNRKGKRKSNICDHRSMITPEVRSNPCLMYCDIRTC